MMLVATRTCRLVVLATTYCFLYLATQAYTSGQMAGPTNDAPLNPSHSNEWVVHVVPHSHCDAGWLKTVDEYDRGSVRLILSNVVAALRKDPRRRFVWNESVYLARWFGAASEEERTFLKGIVQSGQLEFVGGGWVQNDDAITSFSAIMNQMMEGLQFIYDNFQVQPKVGWQIDVFGSSPITPWIFQKLGIKKLILNRIDFRQEEQMKQQASMEFYWDTLVAGESFSTLTHVMGEHYSAPKGFDFEGNLYENPRISPDNILQRSLTLIREIRRRKGWYQTPHVLVPFGDDFKFQDAEIQFSNMDQVMEFINSEKGQSHHELKGVKIQYSTPSEYFSLVENVLKDRTVQKSIPVQSMVDFFPYIKKSYPKFYSGFFSSRPELKILTRKAERLLTGAEKLISFRYLFGNHEKITDDTFKILRESRRNISVLQHHDAVTGTSRTHVNTDYANILKSTLSSLENLVCISLSSGKLKSAQYSVPCSGQVRLQDSDNSMDYSPLDTKMRQLIFVSNSQPWERREYVSIRVKNPKVSVKCDGIYVPSQTVSTQIPFSGKSTSTDDFTLVFEVDILGFDEILCEVDPIETNSQNMAVLSNPQPTKNGQPIVLENSYIKLIFDEHGKLQTVTDMKRSLSHDIRLEVREYQSGTHDEQYLFDPFKDYPDLVEAAPTTLKTTRGPVFHQLNLIYGDVLDVTIRLYKVRHASIFCDMFQIITHSRPRLNTDLVLRFVPSRGTLAFGTDNNGLWLQKREEPNPFSSGMSEKYFPVTFNAAISIKATRNRLTKDPESSDATSRMDIFTRRAFGATGFCRNETYAKAPCVELMLHRRTAYSHSGSIEPLNDEFMASDSLWVKFGESYEGLNHTVFMQTEHPLLTLSDTHLVGDGTKNQPNVKDKNSPSLLFHSLFNPQLVKWMTFHAQDRTTIGLRLHMQPSELTAKDLVAKWILPKAKEGQTASVLFESDIAFRNALKDMPRSSTKDKEHLISSVITPQERGGLSPKAEMTALVVDWTGKWGSNASPSNNGAGDGGRGVLNRSIIFMAVLFLVIVAYTCYYVCGFGRSRWIYTTMKTWRDMRVWKHSRARSHWDGGSLSDPEEQSLL